MPATVIIEEHNGAGSAATQTDKTSGTVRFKNADNALVNTANPLVIPSSGQEYSFEKWLRLNVTVAPSTEISNVREYSDGANNFGTGVKLWASSFGHYADPVIPIETNDPPLDQDGAAMTNWFTYTSAAPQDLDDDAVFSGAGEIGRFVALVMEVETTATQGTLTAETATFSFDEI